MLNVEAFDINIFILNFIYSKQLKGNRVYVGVVKLQYLLFLFFILLFLLTEKRKMYLLYVLLKHKELR